MREHEDIVSLTALEEFVKEVNPATYTDNLLNAVREYVDEDLPHYSTILFNAFVATEPVFTRTRYAEFFWHCASTVPGWLPQVVLANAEAESHGSDKLLELWKVVDYNREVENNILAHANDESRHSRLFLQLARRGFPKTIDVGLADQLNELLPDVRHKLHSKGDQMIPENLLIDHLVQMNIGEIRTRIHMYLLAPVIFAFASDHEKHTVQGILEGLVRDEVRHIGYTARLMERWITSGDHDLIGSLYNRRLADFNRITIEQTGPSVRNYGQGRFPDLLEI